MTQHHPAGNTNHRQPDPNANPSDPASWPTMPDPATGPLPSPLPLPTPTQRGYGQGPRDWQQEREERDRQREQEREAREEERRQQLRRDYLWRKQFDLRLERQRLDAEEQSLKLAWDALPQPASRLVRLLITLAILAIIIAALAFYPALLIPLIVVLFIVGRLRRQRSFSPRPPDNPWAERERYRIQSRIAWIDARVAAIAQEEQAISYELLALTAQRHPQP